MNKKALFNPFEEYRENTLITIGVVATLVGSLLAYLFHGRFDGVIDLHFGGDVKIAQPFLDNLINVICLSACLFLVGKYINGKTRILDILIAVLIARIPLYVITLFNINDFIFNITSKVETSFSAQNISSGAMPDLNFVDMAILLLFALLSVACLVWFIVLLYNGFKTATNSKTVTHRIYFALAIVVAEVISKAIFIALV